MTNNLPIRIYVNKIENRITSKIQLRYYIELLTHEAMKLLGSTKSKLIKITNGKDVPPLEITEVVLAHFNIINDDYQHDSGVLYRFISNESLGKLFEISPKKIIFLETFNSEFLFTQVWLTVY